MKTLLALVCLLAAGTGQLWAQNAGGLGAGIALGSQTGPTAKYWLNGGRAIDAGLGFNNSLTLYGDYLWHSWRVFPQPAEGKIPAYLGLGAQFGGSSRHGNNVGVRGVAGVAYWLPRNPLEIFLEIVPVIYVSDTGGTSVDANIGLRYYF